MQQKTKGAPLMKAQTPNAATLNPSQPTANTTAEPNSAPRSRYRNLIASIIIFLLLIAALLAYTFYTSSVLQANTSMINTSNRVANDTQAVIKDLFDMQNSYGEDPFSPHMSTVLERLKDNSTNIDKNISLMQVGGTAVDAEGRRITLPKITDAATLQALSQTEQQWQQLKPKIQDYLKIATNITQDAAIPLSVASEQAKTSSLAMNDALGTLTQNVFDRADAQANTIRFIQLVGVAVILGYFAIFIFFFVKRLRDADNQTLQAQKETQDIMANVNTGLFLLDSDLNIGSQYSAHLEDIIGETQVGGKNLTSILQNKVSSKDLETTQGFVKQLYNPRVKEKLVNDLNPLKKVMLSNHKNQSRFLDFKFSRVYHQNSIEKILVNVQDITHQVRLEQKLEQERAQNDLQIEMLTTILNVSPKIIHEFVLNTKDSITKINDVLKKSGNTAHELQEKLKSMYRLMHGLKGESSALKLHSFTNIASNFEETLIMLQSKEGLAGNDFLPLTIHLDELLNLSNTIDALGRRINQTSADSGLGFTTANASEVTSQQDQVDNQQIAEALISQTGSGMHEFYQQFAANIATRQNKKVQLKVSGLNDIELPHATASAIKKIVIQLLRNAVVHGIETPENRTATGKSPTGIINLSLLDLAESYKLTIEDDGQGIDLAAIKQKAIQMGYAAHDVEQWSEQKLISLLFKSGFTTKDTADEDAGRGIGMDMVKEDIQQLQGHISVDTKAGKMTKFTLRIPKNVAKATEK